MTSSLTQGTVLEIDGTLRSTVRGCSIPEVEEEDELRRMCIKKQMGRRRRSV